MRTSDSHESMKQFVSGIKYLGRTSMWTWTELWRRMSWKFTNNKSQVIIRFISGFYSSLLSLNPHDILVPCLLENRTKRLSCEFSGWDVLSSLSSVYSLTVPNCWNPNHSFWSRCYYKNVVTCVFHKRSWTWHTIPYTISSPSPPLPPIDTLVVSSIYIFFNFASPCQILRYQVTLWDHGCDHGWQMMMWRWWWNCTCTQVNDWLLIQFQNFNPIVTTKMVLHYIQIWFSHRRRRKEKDDDGEAENHHHRCCLSSDGILQFNT